MKRNIIILIKCIFLNKVNERSLKHSLPKEKKILNLLAFKTGASISLTHFLQTLGTVASLLSSVVGSHLTFQ